MARLRTKERMVVMGEILDAFLEAFDAGETKRCGPHCGHWEDMQELERLRFLITAWADADDAVSRDDYFNTLRIREQARDALRKAVGR